jgi:hypothetical protein
MEIFGQLILVAIGINTLVVPLTFMGYLLLREAEVSPGMRNFYLGLETISLLVNPAIFFTFLVNKDYLPVCCDFGDSSVLAFETRPTVLTLIVFSLLMYGMSKFSKGLLPPLVEVIIQVGLVMGFLLNGLIAIQLVQNPHSILIILGNLPVFCLYSIRMLENHHRIIQQFASQAEFVPSGWEKWLWVFLKLKFWQKMPILILLIFPLILLIISILLLFGQKPNAIISAFTQTYKHTFSQLPCQPECNPDEHYLCTVASRGHSRLVKPIRAGYRRGRWIAVNRQLLIANAFEDLLAEQFPRLHRLVRKVYDYIGLNIIQTHRTIQTKWVCSIVYVLMKPLEWFFLLTLYLFCRRPEDKIAMQYLPPSDKLWISRQKPAQ